MIGKISSQTKMLLIIVPLMVVPMLTLAIVSFLAARSSLLMCLCGRSYTMVSCCPRRSEFVPKWSGCGQDLSPPEAYSTGERAVAYYCLYPHPPSKTLGHTASNQLTREGRS